MLGEPKDQARRMRLGQDPGQFGACHPRNAQRSTLLDDLAVGVDGDQPQGALAEPRRRSVWAHDLQALDLAAPECGVVVDERQRLERQAFQITEEVQSEVARSKQEDVRAPGDAPADLNLPVYRGVPPIRTEQGIQRDGRLCHWGRSSWCRGASALSRSCFSTVPAM